MTIADLVDLGTLTHAQVELLGRAVRGRVNVVVSGGTGKGENKGASWKRSPGLSSASAGQSRRLVTRPTLRTRDLPEFFGGVFTTIKASSNAAFRQLIGRLVGFYADSLFNPHWGEQMAFRPNNTVMIAMLSQGLDRAQAEGGPRWTGSPARRRIHHHLGTANPERARPAFWIRRCSGRRRHRAVRDWPGAPRTMCSGRAISARRDFSSTPINPPGCPPRCWGRIGRSSWPMPCSPASQPLANDAVFQQGAGRARRPRPWRRPADTAMTGGARAFALVDHRRCGSAAYPHVPGHEPDLAVARRQASSVGRAMNELRKLVPDAGSCVSESDFFDYLRQSSGLQLPRLLAVKKADDPDGLFFVHLTWAARIGAPMASRGLPGAETACSGPPSRGRAVLGAAMTM